MIIFHSFSSATSPSSPFGFRLCFGSICGHKTPRFIRIFASDFIFKRVPGQRSRISCICVDGGALPLLWCECLVRCTQSVVEPCSHSTYDVDPSPIKTCNPNHSQKKFSEWQKQLKREHQHIALPTFNAHILLLTLIVNEFQFGFEAQKPAIVASSVLGALFSMWILHAHQQTHFRLILFLRWDEWTHGYENSRLLFFVFFGIRHHKRLHTYQMDGGREREGFQLWTKNAAWL